jgi:YgiT-type zinc finger domain-containing protein
MRCERCDQGDRVAVRRAKIAERAGKVAVVLGVPMEECSACGERWLAWDVAERLDEMLTTMLDSDAEVATRHFDDARTAA